jgi:hypothetical protein
MKTLSLLAVAALVLPLLNGAEWNHFSSVDFERYSTAG